MLVARTISTPLEIQCRCMPTKLARFTTLGEWEKPLGLVFFGDVGRSVACFHLLVFNAKIMDGQCDGWTVRLTDIAI